MTRESKPKTSAWSTSKHLRLAAMLCVIGWIVIYRLSEQSATLPEFVYVNF